MSELGSRDFNPLWRPRLGVRIIDGLRAANIQRQWLINVLLLVAGLGLGQGIIFAVQTALLAVGEFRLLAQFGVHYSFAILAVLMIDGGGSIILARIVARQSARESDGLVWQAFCEMSVIRLLIATVAAVVAVTYAVVFAPDEFSRWYVALALPGLLSWAFNAVGLLDGLRMSGVSGITGSMAYLFTAVGLMIAAHRPDAVAGGTLGAAFSLGYLVTLAAQWSVLARKGWLPRYRRPMRAGLLTLAKDSCALLGQLVPGQINMRAQLLISTSCLGVEMTALFVYAKQVVTALTQILGFVLRVEFPTLVQRLAELARPTYADVVGLQKVSLILATGATLATLAVSGAAVALPDFSLHQAAVVIALFAPTIFSISLTMMMAQGLAAIGAYGIGARALAVGSIIGIALTYLLISVAKLYSIVLGELTSHIATLWIAHLYLRKRRSSEPAVEARENC